MHKYGKQQQQRSPNIGRTNTQPSCRTEYIWMIYYTQEKRDDLLYIYLYMQINICIIAWNSWQIKDTEDKQKHKESSLITISSRIEMAWKQECYSSNTK